MNYTITLEISGGTDDLEQARETAERIFDQIFPSGEFGGVAQLDSVTVTSEDEPAPAPELSPEELAHQRTQERMREAYELHELGGVAPGCGILFRAGITRDLNDNDDHREFSKIAVRTLCEQLTLKRLRNLAKFWGAATARDKRSLALCIAETWAQSVHPTYRPRSNHEIVIRSCPAKFYR